MFKLTKGVFVDRRNASRSLGTCLVSAEVDFVNNSTCSVNSKGLYYDQYKHASSIQGVFEFTKGICL